MVYNVCLGLVKHHDDASDLAQEVFIDVYTKLDQFLGMSTLKTWIYRIAVNKSLEYLRKKKAIKRDTELTEISDLNISGERFDHPGVRLQQKEDAAMLFEAIGHLPESQRVAFTLLKVEGLSQDEISKIMGKSISSIESLIHRAKQNLRKTLSRYYEKT